MNYTKFLKNTKSNKYNAPISSSKSPSRKRNEKFKLFLTDEKIKMSVEILKDIQKTKILIQNFHRLDFKFNIDEYMAFFLKDKNQFIDDFKGYLQKGSRGLNL